MTARIRQWLADRPGTVLTGWAIATSFTTYFCMYAFRKPFSAATYGDEMLFGGALELKSAFVISQIIGYCISKYLGIKVCSELRRDRRVWYLIGAIILAEVALLGFATLPQPLKIVAIFINGLPLGMVWGFVVSYLEGRRTSEMQLAGLSCAYIVASGVVKDVGRGMMDLGISEYWMPFATGLLFFPFLLLSVFLLNLLPEPNAADIEERVERRPMMGAERWEFCKRFAMGLSILVFVYFFLTAFRDIRDTYGVEILKELGYGEMTAVFTRTEIFVAFGVMAALMPISFVHNNRRALFAVYFGLLVSGCALIGLSTFALQAGMISGLVWMALVGLGGYLAYVPYGSVLFDRIVAATRTVGTAVFAIYLTDAVGYTGSVALQLWKNFAQPEATWLQFFTSFCYVMALGGGVLFAISYFDFARAARRAETEHAAQQLTLATAEAAE